MMRWRLVVAAAIPFLTGGCLQKDTASTIYLDPDGRSAWIVVERNVRSDNGTQADRDREERAFVEAVGADRHPTAAAFRVLGGRDVRSTWLRDRRPWSVAIEAAFDSLDAPWEAALTACGIPHASVTAVEDGITTWRLELQVPDADPPDRPDCDVLAEGLLDALEGSIVLTQGRFVGAEGFDLSGPGPDRAVVSKDAISDDGLERSGGRLVLSLSWAPSR